MRDIARFGMKYQPHWLWATCFLFAPFALMVLGFVGIWPQPLIPLSFAELGPRLAVLLSLIGIAAALVRRKRITFGIVGLGGAMTGAGYLLLSWLS